MSTSTPATDSLEGLSGLRVALVHDWLTGYRGGEKVLHVLCELFPKADIYTLIHVPGSSHPDIESHPIHASWMSRLPNASQRYRFLLPLFPKWADGLDLRGYDLVVSTSHCVAKGATAPDGVHVCYCFTPMRYVWDRFDDYFGHLTGPKRALIEWQARRLREWDKRSASRVHHFIGDSTFVRQRILRFYGVPESKVEVLFAPVDLQAFPAVAADHPRSDRYLVVSALVPYKRVDVAVEACARSGRSLTVAGSGPEMARLRSIVERHGASDRISLLGFVPDEQLPSLMADHRAFLFPGVEDFGITPLEAAASGLPVLALGEGGALDTVVDGVTGRHYEDPSVEGLIAAMDAFEGDDQRWDSVAMRQHTRSFARDHFKARLAERLDWAVRFAKASPAGSQLTASNA